MSAHEQRNNKARPPAPHLAKYRFRPGQSGNPGGRPRGTVSFVQELRNALQETPNGEGKTRMRMILDAMITKAQDGDIQHCRELIDRIDGKQLATALGATAEGGAVSVDQMLITIQRVRAELPADWNDHTQDI